VPQQDFIKNVQAKGPAKKINGVLFIPRLALLFRKFPQRRVDTFTYVLTPFLNPEFQLSIDLRNMKTV
jgi:hypothetical protein